MKYIFVVGAPGSKWSSVCKNIYFSSGIDRSDYSESRLYTHHANGQGKLMHIGAYFDPGMEFGDFFDKITNYSKEQCEAEFDRPFSGTGIRIIKSHVLAHHIEFLKEHWPECPVVMVHRPSDACLGWWVRCGHFDIKYPNYQYYENLEIMAGHIDRQNGAIIESWDMGKEVVSNLELCDALGIARPPADYHQIYKIDDIKVKVM